MHHNSSYYKLVTCNKCRSRKVMVAGDYPDIVTATCGNCKTPNDEIRVLHRAIPEINWVKTSERLPKNNQEVLFINSSGSIESAYFNKWRSMFEPLAISSKYLYASQVKYWMPAPPLPGKDNVD